MARRLIILGVTGSIGGNAVDIVLSHPGEFQVVAVAANRRREECEATAAKLGAKAYCGDGAALAAVVENDADVCLVATVGLSGLKPTLAAIEKGMDIALATKEVLVMAGELVRRRASARGVRILPVDSEHSAIFQCIQGSKVDEIDRIVLTASGGPFLDSPADLSSVSVAAALDHPRWRMGPKVTVDSATMMNKGFEIVEASWFFGLPADRIDVAVHPESIVHSLVTMVDGATLAQLSPPDMRVAIQYALSWPRRIKSERARLDLAALGALTFRAPDEHRFPCIRLAREAIAAGGLAPAVLAAADELAVAAFLDGRIGFMGIPRLVERALESVPSGACDSEESVAAAVDAAKGAFIAELKSGPGKMEASS